MSGSKLRVWDPAEHLSSEEDVAAYLDAAFEDGDPKVIAAALGDVARARGMTDVARASGLGRQSLYKALSEDGRPEFATVLRVIQAMGFRVSVMPDHRRGDGVAADR
jgi:probable addiction module antidote protein